MKNAYATLRVLLTITAGYLLLLGCPLRAQSTAALLGTVTDPTGAVLPGAKVTATNTGTGVAQTATSNSAGSYTFPLLQVGTYSIQAEASGFSAFSAPALTVAAGDRARLDIQLTVGGVAQKVEVSASLPVLQTDSSNVGDLVTSQAVQDLPLNGRNVVKLIQLTAGVNEGLPNSKASGTIPDDRRQTSAFSVNGQPDFENNNLVDGMDNNERLLGTIGVRPAIDAIQEVNVSTNLYRADVGRTAGGVADVITKSGTNNFHGSLFEFFRNKVLNTNPNYTFGGPAAPNPGFQQNQFGGSIGGPIIRQKAFFFMDYEGLKLKQGLNQTLYTVPTLCERGLAACPDGKTQFGDFSDINTISALNGGTTPGGPGPTIPSGLITPLGLAYFNMYPLPTCGPGTGSACASTSNNGTVNNYASAPARYQTNHTADARVDFNLRRGDTLFSRYTINDLTTLTPDGFPSVKIDPLTGNRSSGGVSLRPSSIQFAGPNYERQQAVALSYTHLFQPTLTLILKTGYLRSAIQSLPLNQGTNVSTALGFPCNSVSCVNFDASAASGLAGVAVTQTNYSVNPVRLGDSGAIPEAEYDNSFSYSAAVLWSVRTHNVKVGASYIHRVTPYRQQTTSNGTFSFTGAYTGVGFGDLLEGLAISQTRSNELNSLGLHTNEPSVYVQDDWRIAKWLTLNLGLRYDIFTPYTESSGGISNYNPYLGLLVSPSFTGPQKSNATAGVQTNYGDIAPRIGFAATFLHNTVLHGGFGLTYYPTNYLSQNYMRNAPFNYVATCQVQNTAKTNSVCTAPFASSAVTHYGNNNGSNQVNQTGGALLSAGLPNPTIDFSSVYNTSGYAGRSIVAIPINRKDSYLEQFNLQLQQELHGNTFTIGYVGALGRHINYPGSTGTITVPENQPANADQAIAGLLPLTLGGSTKFGNLPGFPYLQSTTVNDEPNDGWSSYHALQTSLIRRPYKGLGFSVNYTWAHMMDNTEGGTSCVSSQYASPQPCYVDASHGTAPPPTGTAPHLQFNGPIKLVYGWQHYGKGNSTLDVPNRIAGNINYQIPAFRFQNGFEGVLLKGWSLSLSGSWQSGLPFTVTEATSVAGLGGVGNIRLDQVGSGKLSNPTLTRWFDLSSFVRQQTDTLGDEEANQLFGPRQRKLDLSLDKRFALERNMTLEFRTDVFNVTNTPNFGNPNASISSFTGSGPAVAAQSGAVDTITTLNGNQNSRQLQFALRLSF